MPAHTLWFARDVVAGVIFLAIALAFGVGALNYDLGTPFRMGPGFMPLLLAAALGVIGLVSLVQGIANREPSQPAQTPFLSMALISCALLIFASSASLLGLVPITFICTFLTAISSRENSVTSAAAISTIMTALCYVIFKIGLAITMPSFGTLFQF